MRDLSYNFKALRAEVSSVAQVSFNLRASRPTCSSIMRVFLYRMAPSSYYMYLASEEIRHAEDVSHKFFPRFATMHARPGCNVMPSTGEPTIDFIIYKVHSFPGLSFELRSDVGEAKILKI